MSEHHIRADHLELCMATRRMHGVARFAAMSDGTDTNSCSRRSGHYRIQHGPLMVPMNRGQMRTVVERTRLHHGLDEVRRTWGIGLRAMRAANESSVMR